MNTIEIKTNDVLLGDYTLTIEVDEVSNLYIFKEEGFSQKTVLEKTLKLGINSIPLETRFNDGSYTIILLDNENNILDTKELKSYGGLLTYIRKGINNICFECDECKKPICNGCNDATTDELNLFLAVIHYYNSNFITYYPIKEYVSSLSFKEMDKEFTKFINKTKIGINKTPQINYRRMILLYYSSIMLGEIIQANSFREEEAVKEMYGYDTYKSCFNKEGFRLEDMLEKLKDDTRVYYWQTSMGMQIDALTDDLDLVTLKENRSEKYNTFENGFTIELNQVGKLVLVVRYSNGEEHVIMDMLGNDVTNSFETKFLPELNARVYLSKVHYINSNIYFKFKYKEKQ